MTFGKTVRMEPKDRLMQAIREKGYATPTDAWRDNRRALGFSQSLMINNCNGNNDISKKAAQAYAKVFGHTVGWYLYAEGEEASADAPAKAPESSDLKKVLAAIAELPQDELDRLLARRAAQPLSPAKSQPDPEGTTATTTKQDRRKHS